MPTDQQLKDNWALSVDDGTAYEAAYKLARGSYQRAILDGDEAVSGSTLKGKARQYNSRYARSRRALYARMRAAGIPFHVAIGPYNRNVLILGCNGIYAREGEATPSQ